MKNFLKQKLDMTLLFMQEKVKMLKKFMLIQIFCVLGLNIFVLHFLMNGLRKKMENLFSKNQTLRHNYSISFLGKVLIFMIVYFKKKYSNHLIILIRFIYCGNIELKNLQGPDVLKLLIAVDELNIQQLITHIQEYFINHQIELL